MNVRALHVSAAPARRHRDLSNWAGAGIVIGLALSLALWFGVYLLVEHFDAALRWALA